DLVDDYVFREIDLVQVKGKHHATRIFSPVGPETDLGNAVKDRVASHNAALGHYYQREWDTAAEIFRELQSKLPEDPLYPFYLERLEGFRTNPPPEEWGGERRFILKR
ncbi:MAG: adenylate/guanylate cyclase domain-containing protein, partial [Gammaproteobacteria bacterium]